MKREYDKYTGWPLPTTEEWHDGITSENLREMAIIKVVAKVVGVIILAVIAIFAIL